MRIWILIALSLHQVVHEHCGMLAPMAVDAVCRLVDPAKDTVIDLKDIRIVKKLGGTVEDSKMVDGIIFTQKTQGFGGPNKIEKAKIGLIQFCISPPKTDVSHRVEYICQIFNMEFLSLNIVLH